MAHWYWPQFMMTHEMWHWKTSADLPHHISHWLKVMGFTTTLGVADNNRGGHVHLSRIHFQQIVKVHYPVKQGKSEGFESCDRPIVRKRPIRVKSGDVLSRVTLKFDGWLWKTIGHLSFAVSSFVQHFITISEFKLELLSRNAQFR